jgi:hypothetical protein
MMLNLDSLSRENYIQNISISKTRPNNAPFTVHRTLLCVTCRGEHLISKESCFAVRAQCVPCARIRCAGMCWFYLMLIYIINVSIYIE